VDPEPTPAPAPAPTPAPSTRPTFRFGAGGGLGAFVPGPSVTFQAAVRAGVQLEPTLGLYAELGGLAGLGVGVSPDGGEARFSGVVLSYLAPMIEYDQGALFVAGGPLLARGGWGYAKVVVREGQEEAVGVGAGGSILPGLQGRAGVTLGSSHGRKGTTLALDTKLFLARTDSTDADFDRKFSLAIMPTFYVGWDYR
jgi:hypothetical protein